MTPTKKWDEESKLWILPTAPGIGFLVAQDNIPVNVRNVRASVAPENPRKKGRSGFRASSNASTDGSDPSFQPIEKSGHPSVLLLTGAGFIPILA
jgi:hypothetical protein